jgi:hypothetical protein
MNNKALSVGASLLAMAIIGLDGDSHTLASRLAPTGGLQKKGPHPAKETAPETHTL